MALARGRTAAACREAVEHLLGLGHERVWHVAGPQDWWEGRERLEGWAAAHRERGIEPPPPFEGDWSPAAGYAAGRAPAARGHGRVLRQRRHRDRARSGRSHEAGRRVPEDVSVVGFDDIPAAAYLSPPLTTVRQDFEADATHGLTSSCGSCPEPPSRTPTTGEPHRAASSSAIRPHRPSPRRPCQTTSPDSHWRATGRTEL